MRVCVCDRVYHRQKNKTARKQNYNMESVAVMMSDTIPHSFQFKMVASVVCVVYQIIKEQSIEI